MKENIILHSNLSDNEKESFAWKISTTYLLLFLTFLQFITIFQRNQFHYVCENRMIKFGKCFDSENKEFFQFILVGWWITWRYCTRLSDKESTIKDNWYLGGTCRISYRSTGKTLPSLRRKSVQHG